MDRLNNRPRIEDSQPVLPHQHTHVIKKESDNGVSSTYVTNEIPPSHDGLSKSDLSLSKQLESGIPLNKVTLHTGNKLMLADQVLGYLSSLPDYVKPTVKTTVEPSNVQPSTIVEPQN